jgi:hypothetical protein
MTIQRNALRVNPQRLPPAVRGAAEGYLDQPLGNCGAVVPTGERRLQAAT